MASQLGTDLKTFSPKHLQDLLQIKQSLDIPDSRFGLKECELCDNDEWRPGASCAVPATPAPSLGSGYDDEAEAVVRLITDRIMDRLNESN